MWHDPARRKGARFHDERARLSTTGARGAQEDPIDPHAFVGRHLLLDVRTASERGLTEPQAIYDFLEALTARLGMSLVYPPLVSRFPFAASELDSFVASLAREGVDTATVRRMKELLTRRAAAQAGLSGVAVWLESHASVHSWAEHRFFSFDAFTCKDFETRQALELVHERFDVSAYSGLTILRTFGAPQVVERLSWPQRGAASRSS